jgi:hypothetical protein
LPFYRYNVVHPDTKVEGSIIASGNKRVGNIIAYIEYETNDTAVTPFMQMLTANLEDYVTMIIDMYNSTPAEDTESVVQKSAIPKFGSVANIDKQTQRLGQVNKDITYLTTTGFKPLTRNINWNQSSGYWEVVNAVRDTHEHLVGCIAVAMRQIRAYHRWPGVCNLDGEFTDTFNSTETVNFHRFDYDWQAMIETDNANNLKSLDGKFILLYDAGIKVNTQYGPISSGAYR